MVNGITVYHGTVWDRDIDEVFFSPSAGYSDFDVVYFSQSREVAERFAGMRASSSPEGIKVVLQGRLLLTAPSTFSGSARSPYHVVGDSEFHVGNDREELFLALQRARHDAFIIPGNYGDDQGQDDIAVFDDGLFSCETVIFCLEGQWTEAVPVDNAEEHFAEILATMAGPRPPDEETPSPSP